jgi:CubicO group peptidase (beta-lactamase class C family)
MKWTSSCHFSAVAGLLAIAVLVIGPPEAMAAADRYGGVWHPGKGTGAFVPIAAGMAWADVLNYKQSWGKANSFRITDIEVVPKGCPSDRSDLFATQWEKGSWNDKLYVVHSMAEVQNALANECRRGYRLVDFEIWESDCDEPVKYILLFRQDGKPCQYTPLINSAPYDEFGGYVTTYSGYGYTLVDFEVSPGSQQNPTITGVWYYGSSVQEFKIVYRETFDAEMAAHEGSMTLMDMESYRRAEAGPASAYWRRYVAALWQSLPGLNTDDHEIGEVYDKFKGLIYKQESERQLVDFEVYSDTTDARFSRTFDKYLSGIGGGYAFAVLQAGELVAGDAEGYARYSSVPMGIDVRGPVASVTKFFTALGVLRFAETQPNVNLWLDEPLVQHLPGDFGPFGAGVETITIRELLRQTTGLATFTPSVNPVNDPNGFRQEMIAWLGQPLANAMKPFQYQNVHFELLALMMDEVELPVIMSSTAPWRDWMNQEVFANAGVSPLLCGGTTVDALSYPLNNSQGGVEWIDSSWDCAGFGTGVGMFWASALDLAKVDSAFREGAIVSPSTVAMVLSQGLGLDPAWLTGAGVPMQPDNDGSAATIGEELYTKNGGLCGTNGNGDSVGTETLIARFDDYNFDDDGSAPPPPLTNDYLYEVGYRDFDIGIMIHSSAYSGTCFSARSFPIPKAMLQEALLQREDW